MQKRTQTNFAQWKDHTFANDMTRTLSKSATRGSRRSKFGQWSMRPWESFLICSCLNRQDAPDGGSLGPEMRNLLRVLLRQVGRTAAYAALTAMWEERRVDGTTVKATFFATGEGDSFEHGAGTCANPASAIRICFCGQLFAAFTASPPPLWRVDSSVHPPRSIGGLGVAAPGSCAAWRASRPPALQMPLSVYRAGRLMFDWRRARLLRRCFRASAADGSLCSVLPQVPALRRLFMHRLAMVKEDGVLIRRSKVTREHHEQRMRALIDKHELTCSLSILSQLRYWTDEQSLTGLLQRRPALGHFLLSHDPPSVDRIPLPSVFELCGMQFSFEVMNFDSARAAGELRDCVLTTLRDALFYQPASPRIWLADRWQIDTGVAVVVVSRGTVLSIKVPKPARTGGKRRRGAAAAAAEAAAAAAEAPNAQDIAFILADLRIQARLDVEGGAVGNAADP